MLQIAIDGEHFCAFAYRLPLQEIMGLEFHDDIEEAKVRQTNIYVYPDPKICKPSRILELTDAKPLDTNLVSLIRSFCRSYVIKKN